MANLNKVLLVGNLTKDPEQQFSKSGLAAANMGVAVNRTYMQEGVKKKEVDFFNIVAWGKQAEACCKYLHKGSSVLIEGRLRQESWEKNGEKRSAVKIIAERVEFLGDKRGTEEKAPSLQEDDEVPF